MLNSQYIEDTYIEFYQRLLTNFWTVPAKETEALSSFYVVCVDNKAFTEKQANYMITLMRKYKDTVCDETFDCLDSLNNPIFKNQFRVIDENKKAYIEKSTNGEILICFKFPYAFKATFDKEISQLTENKNSFKFDHEAQARKINFYEINLMIVYEFAVAHNFEIDESILHAVSETETAWDNQDELVPVANALENNTTIRAKNQHSNEFFDNFKTGSRLPDIFLAKTMGYPARLEKSPEHPIEKIAVSKSNTFWIQENSKLFEIYKILNCKIAIILDRNDNIEQWIKNFTAEAENHSIEKSKIKVCFRDTAGRNKDFNEWIRSNQHGGKVAEGDIYIFDHKPAKWLFKEPNYVKIIVTTTKFMPTAPITKELINVHPCAVYLSDIKPTVKGNKKLVKL